MKNRRIWIDAAMTLLLPLLMAYSLIGETFHEVAGTAMLVLFLWHHWLNRQWFKHLFRGKYTARRVFSTAINLLLLTIMILQPVSGILMSRHLYIFLPALGLAAYARRIHLLLAYWGFILMCVHAGTHFEAMAKAMAKGNRNAHAAPGVKIAVGLVSVYGCYAFVKRQLPSYLFLRASFVFFDFSEPRLFFFADYIAMMVLFGTAGFGIMKLFQRQRKDHLNT